VHAEDFFVDDGGDGETVETVGESLPEFDTVSSFACFKVQKSNEIFRG
jgi:hypothetical protein